MECRRDPATLAAVTFLLMVLGATVPALATTRHSHRASFGSYTLRFDEDLGLSHAIRLRGEEASRSVDFYCESSWQPEPGTVLHLFIAHSPNLDGSRSFLALTLNYGTLRSIRLDSQDEQLTEITIPIPPKLLKRENRLAFAVEQSSIAGAGRSGPWTTISKRSFIRVEYNRNAPRLDLRLLPAPLLDQYSYRPQSFDVLLPAEVSTLTLNAMALFVANVSNWFAPKAARVETVRSIRQARSPLLIVGTPQEQPELWALRKQVPFVLKRRDREPLILLRGGESLGPAEGLVGDLTAPWNTMNPIVYVTGNSPLGVLRAVDAMILRRKRLSGDFTMLSNEPEAEPERPRRWKGFIPPSRRFTLHDLGFQALAIGPENNFTLQVPLEATPDSHFFKYGSTMLLHFQFDSSIFASQSEVQIDLNGKLLGKFPIAEIAKRPNSSVRLRIPPHVLAPHNLLTIKLGHLPAYVTQPAEAYLLRDSSFYWPRDYEVKLPDLALLQFHLYPFSLRGDLSDTLIVVPHTISEGLMRALLDLASALGRHAPTKRLAFHVKRVNEVTDSDRARSNFIFLGISNLGSTPEKFFPRWPRLTHLDCSHPEAVVQEVVSPWNSNRFVLSVTASTGTSLESSIRQIFSQSTLSQLTGDTALLRGRHIASLRLEPARWHNDVFYFVHLEAWMKTNWLILPVILVAFSGVLFFGLRLALEDYKKKGSQS